MVPFRQLSYVVAVADHGSMQTAAEKIAISQPAISAAIKKLETDYGINSGRTSIYCQGKAVA